MNNIMFQGTASTVGKSILTAALCRILNDDGISVAPFKSQNMALNSFITEDGKEMGRAQVVQAEAARIKPQVEMNPILLKPTSDVGSQVILNGKIYKNMCAKDYFGTKAGLKQHIMESYNKLQSKHEVIVIEGAGSPAEINLRENDIVNMGMAEMVDAPVVLIGDIDKGGVFASIYGTVMLLEPEERKRIKGYVINKFRGDVKILQPGIDMFYEKLQIPCLGVIPYESLKIDDEDSVTERFDMKEEADIIIGVLRLPHMSNFTDFTVFELEDNVSVRYIKENKDYEGIDLLIIPGSKNTIKDMEYIHNSSLKAGIYRAHRNDVPIIGICGGYQILGETIEDEKGVETSMSSINGLGLLEIITEMEDSKQTTQITGNIIEDIPFAEKSYNLQVSGYEIHMGKTELMGDSLPLIKLQDGRIDGAMNAKKNVMGTYLHGIFDNDELRKLILDNIKNKKGLDIDSNIDYAKLKDIEYDKLAKLVRDHMDIDKIKDIIYNR
ncbi:cobyric acid synthase [Vallitalea longa]|uniref:Cobyric acid synthase n=1 Tax=Vallitalea longa TaxID=2936439 RepID=A0A9W5YFE3_9FIRM|nr:cobyric acid synthase [Vallitalea longa]GKX32054.1 cobyric acid synthase [Vallitalea longa]